MKFRRFAEYLNELESTAKRLEITSILTDLLNELSVDTTDTAVYLSLGYLKAPFENPKFNIAEKMMIRTMEAAYQKTRQEIEGLYSKSGDLGNTALQIAPDKVENELTIKEVYDLLWEISQAEGAGSQETKVNKTASLLQKLDKTSAKYVVRIILGTTRLGFTELTVIDALSKLVNGDKTLKTQIEEKYNIHPDIGLIAKKIKSQGMEGIKEIGIEIGVPILPQKCQRLSNSEEIIQKMGKVSAEYKFDGTRVQLHMDRKKHIKSKSVEQNELFAGGDGKKTEKVFVRTYTRNLEETTHQYPEIIEEALSHIEADSIILDGEAIGYNKETGEFLPFQEIMQRKRKHGIAETAKEIPVKYFVFDLLYLNGKSLTEEPLEKRRKILESVIKPGGKVISIDNNLVTSDPHKLEAFFEESKELGLEGLVIKKPDAPYQAGARSYTWVKLKKAETKHLEDTIDTVILGYSYGRGVRAAFGIGQFLAGIFDKKTNSFKSITKVGTGLKDEDFVYLKKEADKLKIDKKPANVEIDKVYTPDVWVSPKIVVELGADEISKSSTHTAGYALRFPRLIKFRADKKPEDITSLDEIENMYKLQKRGYYIK
jgi:DNA ligase 1